MEKLQEAQEMISYLLSEKMGLERQLIAAKEEAQELKELVASIDPDAVDLGDFNRKRVSERFVIMYYPTFDIIETISEKNPSAVKLMLYLTRNADINGCYIESIRSMSIMTGLADKTVQKGIKLLAELNYIIIGKSGQTSVYAINPNHLLKMSTKQRKKAAYYQILKANDTKDPVAMRQTLKALIRLDSKGIQDAE